MQNKYLNRLVKYKNAGKKNKSFLRSVGRFRIYNAFLRNAYRPYYFMLPTNGPWRDEFAKVLPNPRFIIYFSLADVLNG